MSTTNCVIYTLLIIYTVKKVLSIYNYSCFILTGKLVIKNSIKSIDVFIYQGKVFNDMQN